MDRFVIKGPNRLVGTVDAGGSKNCALPVLFATLLAEGRHSVRGVPRLMDMESSQRMLVLLGCEVDQKFKHAFGSDWIVDASNLSSFEAPYDYVRKMRASNLCLGPLLARMGKAKVSLPGGCAIGARPMDLHILALERLGATIDQKGGFISAEVKNKDGRLHGAEIVFPLVSVGATENAVMAATLARGRTLLRNAAQEPEIVGLCEALLTMGAKISGHGTSTIEIEGVDKLRPMDFRIPADRIETATYLIGAHMTGGDVFVKGARAQDLTVPLQMLEQSGARIESSPEGVRCISDGNIKPVDATTAPFPAFPTDLQAQWLTLMTQAAGDSLVTETIFENRFMHVPELIRMGADLTVNGSAVRIKGKPKSLEGAPVMATDLRASASLVLAGCAARGETSIKRIYHLDRGYESMETKLRQLGAQVERQTDS
jgi:UDP-N-acetylglucosamine 1-carboxyvinyltransferase